MILSIHDLNLTSLFADKVMILKESQIHTYVMTKQTLTEEHIRREYGVETAVTMEEDAAHVR